ncbi:MAG TPA: sigma-70 family RNA polymerase sigma factor [Gaiellaceae bacterium]|nr:sigma-70 family RNA polymerase sigma factor [Gaiellaceae bacterium]
MAAIEAVYRDQLAAFVRLATAITGDEQAAYDAVHDGFVRAVRYRSQLRDRESAPGWVCRIVLNEARKRSTTERRHVSTPLEAEHEPATNGHRETGAAAAALASLPERQRLALFLRYYADLDYAGIAEALGISRGTVSATLHAAHASLQTKLKEVNA